MWRLILLGDWIVDKVNVCGWQWGDIELVWLVWRGFVVVACDIGLFWIAKSKGLGAHLRKRFQKTHVIHPKNTGTTTIIVIAVAGLTIENWRDKKLL